MDNTTENQNDGTKPLRIEDEMKECYLDYAMSVIVGRALPDVRDGLKPVHRRVLYAMHMLNNYHNRPYLKSARVVGDVIGKYHPHGDSAVYSAIVRLAQDFSMRYPIVDGQGNFGSIDGDSAAAMRYTEVRMQKMAEDLLKDIDKDTIDWTPNYDDSLKEPAVLPTKIPNLLINGSSGIAVGMATNIPPHNLSEVMSALITVVDEPDVSIEQIMQMIPGPDFPTAGTIYGVNGIKQAYHTGKGVIQIRAKSEIETYGKQDRERIVVTELPYQVNKAKLIEKIASLVNNKDITGISDIRDESNRLGIRVVIEIKRGEQANIILNRLYKQTQLQVSFGIIFLSIHKGQPKILNIRDQLLFFVDHRREIVVRRTSYELRKAKEKAHILLGLKTAVENIDDIVELIKKAKGPKEAKEQLMTTYDLSEIQAQAVLDMKLQRLTGLERDKIIADYEAIIKEIARLESILASRDKVNDIIKTEFMEMKEKYGDERRTEIVSFADEIVMEDLIKSEEVIVTVTHKGYVKRMALDTFKAQKRGGKGVKGAKGPEEDFYTNIFTADTHDRLMFFTDKGTVFALKVYNIPEASRTSRGRNIVNLIQVPPGEKVKEILSINIKDSKETEKGLIIATKNGLIKKTALSEYERINQNGKRAIKILDNDEVVKVDVVGKDQEILLASSSGRSVRFSESDCRNMGRVSQGVKGMALTGKETLIGMIVITDNQQKILSVTSLGYGKRTPVEEYRLQSRGGKGIINMKLTPKNGEIVQILPVGDEGDLMVITNSGQVIRTKVNEISTVGRNTQGVRIMNLSGDERVVSVETVEESENEEESDS